MFVHQSQRLWLVALNIAAKYHRLPSMRTHYFAFLILCSLSLSSAQNATYGFLRNDISARAAALNGSFVSMIDDPVGIFYNPTLLKGK
jgi:hypothetical protein